MTQTPPLNQTVTALTETLLEEKKQLLKGVFDDLPSINKKKSHYMALLESAFTTESPQILSAYKEKLSRIAKLSKENEKLLSAAKSGTNAAITRIRSLLDREKTVGTYTQSGYKLQTHDAGVTREKIA